MVLCPRQPADCNALQNSLDILLATLQLPHLNFTLWMSAAFEARIAAASGPYGF